MLTLLSATTREISKCCPQDMQAKRRVGLKAILLERTARRLAPIVAEESERRR